MGFVLLAAVALLARGERAAAQSSTPTPIQTYYLTAFEDNFFNLLDNAEPGAPSSPVTSRTKIVIREAPAIVYFEHYEDGYAVDIAKPRPEELWSPSNPGGVQIWGDGDLSNGAIPGDPENDDLFTSDQIISLVNTVNVPYNPSALKYGGQDKIASSTGIAITRLLWAAGSNSLFGGAHELYPTKLWGNSYTAPVGCDTDTTIADGIFDYTMFSVQAKSNNTTIEIDINRDGTADITETLNEGEEWGPENLSSGYVCGVTSLVQGATVRTTDPSKKIQVVLYMGKDGPPSYQMRDVSLLADGIADYQYYLPVGFTEDTDPNESTGRERAFFYNTSDSTVYLRCDSLTGSAGSQTQTTDNYTIAGKSTAGVDVDSYTGAHCYATTSLGGSTPDTSARLVGISAMDVPFEGDGTTSTGTGMDWTYSLVPSKRLGNQIIVGEGLGQDPGNLPIRENGNPIWITTACNDPATTTYIYVDWDRNGTPDDADLNGDGDWDDVDPFLNVAEADVSNGIPMSRLKAVRLWNNGGNSTWSKDQSGAYVYSLTQPNIPNEDAGTGGCAFAAAWGQDPRIASFAAPGLDVGTTIPPQPPVDFYKDVELLIDADNSGTPGPGDTIRFTITAANDSLNQIDGVRIFDAIPQYTTYVPGSTEKDITADFTLWEQVPDDASGTAFPLDEDPNGPSISFDPLLTGEFWSVRFNVTLDPPNPLYLEVSNTARFWGNEGFVSEDASATLSLYSKIGDTIWYDMDGDGIQDPGEPGIEGITVTLTPPDDIDLGNGLGQPVTTVTDAFGKYNFSLLLPGAYTVTVTPPTGLTQTGDPDGGADSTSQVSLGLGDIDLAQDFGYQPKGAIGDRVWYDLDGDGAQDALEPGIPGQQIMLEADFDEDGTYDATFYTVTDTEGRYLFEGLPPGDYRITVVDPISGTTNTGDPDGTKNGVHVTDLDAGERDLSIDFGYRPPAASIGDTIWYDIDGDGIQDLNEPGIPGVTVTLTKPDGSTATATTDEFGRYLFTDLPDGNYGISVSPPPGTTQTGDPDGTVDLTGAAEVKDGVSVLTMDFGFQPEGQIGDTVYLDTDGDGKQDAGEAGIAGIQVRLELDLNGDGNVDYTYYTTTDDDGKYLFDNLPQGDYIVTVMNPLGGATNTGDPDDEAPDMSYVTLDSNTDTDLDQDFGYQVPAGIGDRVWYDIDGDGVQDPGEPGIPGVTVVLTPEVGEPITTVTGPDGNYYFPNLPAGDYTVTVTPPAGTTPTADPDGGTPNTSDVTLPDGGVNLLQDFGYQPVGKIGDFIWSDANEDGVQDTGEKGIPNLTVTLYADYDRDNIVDATFVTTTDSQGQYLFENLPPGAYTVTVSTPPPGATLTYDPDGLHPHSSEVDLNTTTGMEDLDQDFGYFLPGPGAIGDRVWYDLDGDGVQDPLEPGVPYQQVKLEADYDGDGVIDETFYTVTDTEGRYLFDGLEFGDYTVTVIDPLTGMTQTYDPDGTEDNTTDLELGPAETNLEQDFGYKVENVIGDTIWYDLDGDGIQDLNEPGIPGVTVTLTPVGGGTPVTLVTDDHGRYLFTNVPPGDYTVTVTPPPGVTPTGDPDGTPDNVGTVTLKAGEVILTQDFGYQPAGKIGDTVYLDTNGDGTQGGGEPGIEGVTVQLEADLNQDGIVDAIFTTTTDADGKYLFENLPKGDYTVTVLNPPADSNNTGDPDGGNDSTAEVTLPANTSVDLAQDFGYQIPGGAIGDRIWYDIDGDGVQDPDEPGVPGVAVKLTPPSGPAITVLTDENGNYLFTGLPAGNYTIQVTPPADTTQTGDPDATLNNTSTVVLSAGQINLDQDFGYQPEGQIGDYIWMDRDKDGVQDADENGIEGLTVTLYADYDRDNVVDAVFVTTTDEDGKYLFENLPPGAYTVTVSTIPEDSELTYDPDGLHPHSAEVDLNEDDGMVDLDQDFGYYIPLPVTVGDRVWYDLDGDGVQDPLEPGVPGQQLKAEVDTDGDGIVDETFYTVTDTEGRYLFTIPPGDITITVMNPLPGMTQTGDPDGTKDNSGETSLLAEGEDLTLDFGYKVENVIGDTIWYDLDGDGIQDLNEPGIPGVTVTLTPAAGGTPVTLVTDDYGRYLFTDVPPGDYTITVTPPPGVTATGDPDGTTDNKSEVTLSAGGVILTQDFGYQPTGKIGDTVYLDTNGNGTQGAGEPGIAGVTVQLEADLNQDGIVDAVFVTKTDEDGKYLFENLPKGDYTVTVMTPPADSTNTGDPDGGNDSTAEVTLATNTSVNLNQDFGYQIPGGAIGDRIWYDIDGDGVQDPDEPGVPGVEVTLTPQGGSPITVRTDENGNYLFTGLPAGNYTITVEQPADTTQTGDPDATLNSSSTVTLAADEINLDQDFGYQPEGQIGDYIWMDIDKDGVQDPEEVGFPGLTVTLYADYDRDNVVDAVFVTTTDEDGKYLFDNLAPGAYTVTVSTPPPDSELTYDPDGLHPHSSEVDLNEDDGMVDLDQDFGYYILLPVTVGDRVWYDLDGDGVQDPLEPGVPGQQVKAEVDIDGDGIIDETFYTVTDTEGRYLFTMPPGDITVTVINPIAGLTQTGDPDGTKDNVGTTTLLSTQKDLDLDFGYQPVNVIGDTIWYDMDGDGIQDLNEPGIPGVTVTLAPVGGGTPVTLVTDANGRYLFTNVPPGDYTITVTPPALVKQTGDPDGRLNNQSIVTVEPGSVILDQDFGYQPSGQIGDLIYVDLNGNGRPTAGEPGLPGVTVQLEADFNLDGIVDAIFTTVTDSKGKYLFDNLPQGNYTVTVIDLPEGVLNTEDPNGGSDFTSTVYLERNNSKNLTQDFGVYAPGSVGDRIWYDIDGDGVQDPGEPGIPGVEVTIMTPSGPVKTTTDENGTYLFVGLPAGNYTVMVTPPADTTQTGDPDSNKNNQSTVNLKAGDTNLFQDFGYQPTGKIGDRIWGDMDRDGVQDGDEMGLPRLTVTLYADYDGDNVVDGTFVTTTDDNGNYLFENLPPGDYTVTVSTPPSDDLTYDPDGLHPHSAELSLVPGAMERLDMDFGYYLVNVCVNDSGVYERSDIIGQGMGSPFKVDGSVVMRVPDHKNVVSLYGQIVAKDTGAFDGYARFKPSKGRFINVKTITSPAAQQNAEFWWGTDLTPVNVPQWRASVLNGLKFPYQPRSFLLFPTYNTPDLRWNFFQTYADGSRNTVYWAPSWTPKQTFTLDLPGPLAAQRDITVKVALTDNDVDERPLVVTVSSVGPAPVTLVQAPIGPDAGHLLNILTFTLERVPAGTTAIEVVLESPMATGDSGTITGITANMSCYGTP